MEVDVVIKFMINCISDVSSWMILNNLILNEDKVEFFILGIK